MDLAAAVRARLDNAADAYAEGTIDGQQLTRISAKLRPDAERFEQLVKAASTAPDLDDIAGPDIRKRSVAAVEPASDEEEDGCFVVEWRIDHLLEGSTYCLPVTAAGRPESDVILEAIAVEISEDFLACCVIEYRQLDTDEPWQILQFGDKPTPSVVTESLLGALERVLERLKEALAPELTEDQRVRLVVLLQGGSS